MGIILKFVHQFAWLCFGVWVVYHVVTDVRHFLSLWNPCQGAFCKRPPQ